MFRASDWNAAPLWDADLTCYEDAREAGEWTPDAVFLPHAHLDHVGYLPHLGNVPVVCSESTESLLAAITDVGNLTGFDGELLSMRRRRVDEYGGGYFPGEHKIAYEGEVPRETDTRPGGGSVEVDGGLTIETFPVREFRRVVPESSVAAVPVDDPVAVFWSSLTTCRPEK